MELATSISEWSKDRNTKVGAIIARDKHVVSLGFNGFPKGVDDTVDERHERPQKYLYTEHAERNGIFTALNNGSSVQGCTMYVPLHPCADCTRAIIATGISKVVTTKPTINYLERWGEHYKASKVMLREAGVELVVQ